MSQPLPRVVAFPRGTTAYTECFYRAVEDEGATVIDGVYTGRWLHANLSRFDVFHIHWPSFQYYDGTTRPRCWWRLAKLGLFLTFLRLRGKHVVWTAHNTYPHDGGGELRLHRVGRRLVRLLATRVLVHGPKAAALVQEQLRVPARKIVTIEHGHWIDFYRNACSREDVRKQLGLPGDSTTFLFIGACKPYKNLEPLVDAFQRLPDGAHLVIAGSFAKAEYRERVERAIARRPDRIQLHPRYLADDELQVFLNAADVMVLPYSEILTSGAAMLAFSFGRPVIAPRKGNLIEVVPEACGMLYDPRVPDALLDTMRTFDRRRFDSRQILAHAAGFSWRRAARTFLESCRNAVR
jgi:glycosyltransferase involved in cell wall biosynthesis